MNIRQKMIACGAISVLAATLLGSIGFWGQTRLASALNENQLSVSALRNHLEGDMMHARPARRCTRCLLYRPGRQRCSRAGPH
jgi:hypothetical protein